MENRKLRQVIACLMLGSALIVVPVSAADDVKTITGTGSNTTTVNYTVSSNYTVVIPATLTVTTADGNYTAATNNVFINSHSLIDPGQKITVSLPKQSFLAKDTTNVSTIPFNVKYTTNASTATTVEAIEGIDPVVILLEKTGTQIAGVISEDATDAKIGNDALSAQVQVGVTSAQAAQADVSGSHTGLVSFSVSLG